GTVIGALLGLYLSNFRILSIAFLVGAIAFGFLYNHSSKFMPYAGPFWITISFTCIPLFSYFSVSDAWTLPLLFVVKYTFVLMLVQIRVEGYLKDINVPQANIFFKLGTKMKDGWIRHSFKSRLYMGKLVALKIIIMGIFIYYTIWQWNLVQISIWALLLMILIDLSYEFGKDRKFDNATIVRECALIEITTYLLLITCLWCVIGWQWYLFLFCYPLAWFIAFNRVTWGTTIRPRV
ncbi:MAG: hypothetical protein MUP55_03920, partial [Candidatus Aenigmarchaeota archaeon]|nr:hypothetical protein [Candidatus Aenigmarchaeota archaeon]